MIYKNDINTNNSVIIKLEQCPINLKFGTRMNSEIMKKTSMKIFIWETLLFWLNGISNKKSRAVRWIIRGADAQVQGPEEERLHPCQPYSSEGAHRSLQPGLRGGHAGFHARWAAVAHCLLPGRRPACLDGESAGVELPHRIRSDDHRPRHDGEVALTECPVWSQRLQMINYTNVIILIVDNFCG